MAVAKVIEIIAQSDKSWEEAAQSGLAEAAKTIDGIQSLWVKEMHAVVENNRIVQYRITAKISFLVSEKQRGK